MPIPMQVTWKPNLSTSALHVAEASWQTPDRVTDPEVLATMQPYADRLGRWVADHFPGDQQPFWSTLISTGSTIDSNRELASAVLGLHGRSDLDATQASLLAGLITDVEAAFRGLFPKYVEQSAFRFRPLQEQWLGYGRGLMTQWNRTAKRNSMIDACIVIGMQPVLGGFGKSHPDRDMVRIEAVLTNARPELPEVIRLGWLISQLNPHTEGFFEPVASESTTHLIALATLVPTLAAGQEIELTRCDVTTVSAAIEQWLPSHSTERETPTELASLLLEWWHSPVRVASDWAAATHILAKQLGG
ncbi:MAG: hypothetical protein ACK6A7_13115 [Planctomycetota bacterium]